MSAARARRAQNAQVASRTRRSAAADANRNILDRVGPSKPKMTRLVAKNIGASVSAVDVRSLFATVGTVKEVRAVLGASSTGQRKGAKFPTPISAVFHYFRLIFGRAIISRSALEAWMLFLERSRGTLILKRR
jgi:hypothetical protein